MKNLTKGAFHVLENAQILNRHYFIAEGCARL